MIDSGANCYFLSTKIFNNKSIMSTDVFNLNEPCPAILLDTELRIYNGFYFPVPYWNLVCTGVLCVYTVGALGVCVKMILCCGHPVCNSQSNFGRAITDFGLISYKKNPELTIKSKVCISATALPEVLQLLHM